MPINLKFWLNIFYLRVAAISDLFWLILRMTRVLLFCILFISSNCRIRWHYDIMYSDVFHTYNADTDKMWDLKKSKIGWIPTNPGSPIVYVKPAPPFNIRQSPALQTWQRHFPTKSHWFNNRQGSWSVLTIQISPSSPSASCLSPSLSPSPAFGFWWNHSFCCKHTFWSKHGFWWKHVFWWNYGFRGTLGFGWKPGF